VSRVVVSRVGTSRIGLGKEAEAMLREGFDPGLDALDSDAVPACDFLDRAPFVPPN
jgi:hypothetical protein